MLSKSFKPGKCKTSLKLAVSRIKLLKNKRDIQVKHLRRELAELLATGQEQTARIRVEHVIREEKTMSAYDLIEIYCELIVARMPIIESQKSCPIDLKEAISSVIFASPRCADLPELVDVRKHFVAKYGKDFSTSALELRPDCGVNHMIVEKLSAKAPNIETKIKILTAIAKEHDVKWDSKAYEEEVQKPKGDLLNGSSSFMRANKTPMEPLNANFSPVASQNEAASNILQNEEARKPTSFNSTSHTNLRTSASTVPPTRNESMTSDRKAGVSEARDSYSSEGNASLNQPTWTMEFKDAVSAAQVAAESAERASMAARAAAALAGRGNISRQNSNTDSNASSIHGSRHTMPNRVSSLKLKDESSESVNMDYNQVKGFQGVNEEIENLPREELLRGGILHLNSGDIEFSSQINNAEKFDGFQESFSRMEHVGSKKQLDEVDFVEKNVKEKFDRSTSASSFNTLDDDTIWTPFGKHQTGDSSHQIGDHNQHALSDFTAPVFDDYDPEPNDKRNLFDSFDSKKGEQNIFSIAPRASGVNSNIFNDSFQESRNIKAKKVPSSKFDDSRSVAFDDSDGISSEDEDDLSRTLKSGSVQNNGLLHEEIGPRKELQPSCSSKAISPRGREEKDQIQVPSSSVGAKDSEIASGGELGLKFGKLTGGFKNRGYNYPPYTASSLVDSFLSSKETLGSTFSSREQNISRQEKAFTSHLEADEGRYDQESSWKASTNPESVIKAKGFGVEEYTEVNSSNKTLTRDKSIEDASGLSANQFTSDQESRRLYRGNDQNPAKQDPYYSIVTNASEATGSEAIDQKIYNEKPHTMAYKELSPRMSRTDFDSDGDAGERDSQINLVSKANPSTNSNIKLSRRTRDYFTKGRNNHPRSTGHSDTPTADSESQPLSQAVDEGRVLLGGNLNLKSGRPNSLAEQPLSVNIKNAEERPNPDPTPISSRNVKTLDSSSVTKLQGSEHPKASHIHPKLPDYETLAAHFQSLRSNRR